MRNTDHATWITDPRVPTASRYAAASLKGTLNMTRTLATLPRLILCRSDQGDGGWSLHAPDATDEDIAEGIAPPLLTGTARWVNGAWNWPNARDYAKARKAAPRGDTP